jgi:hypothetical protein
MNTEDDEFNRIEREAKARMMAVRYAMERGGVSQQQISQVMKQMPMAAWVPSQVPLITDEEWEALNKEQE